MPAERGKTIPTEETTREGPRQSRWAGLSGGQGHDRKTRGLGLQSWLCLFLAEQPGARAISSWGTSWGTRHRCPPSPIHSPTKPQYPLESFNLPRPGVTCMSGDGQRLPLEVLHFPKVGSTAQEAPARSPVGSPPPAQLQHPSRPPSFPCLLLPQPPRAVSRNPDRKRGS